MQDYYAATDYIKSRPYVDADHVGAIGASYGGFSVYWLAGHNDGRYAALVAHAGIFNVEAQYLETEEMWFADFDLGGAFWDKRQRYSPAHICKFTTSFRKQLDGTDAYHCRRT